LALAGVPMVGAYKVSRFEEPLKYFIKVSSILLPNLILGTRAIPELLQRECTAENLATALAALVREGAARDAQLQALSRLDELMRLPDGDIPSARAARLILDTIARGAGPGAAEPGDATARLQ
jgi:lipid-A-disaccharide synthase